MLVAFRMLCTREAPARIGKEADHLGLAAEVSQTKKSLQTGRNF